MKYRFPALIKEDKDEPGFVIISFPDLLGIGSECEIGEEEETAKEILELALETPHRRSIEPTDVEVLRRKFPDRKVIVVEVEVD